jgi:hypothetical protein
VAAYALEKFQDQRTAAEKQLEAEIEAVVAMAAVTTVTAMVVGVLSYPLQYGFYYTILNVGLLMFDLVVLVPLLLLGVLL